MDEILSLCAAILAELEPRDYVADLMLALAAIGGV